MVGFYFLVTAPEPKKKQQEPEGVTIETFLSGDNAGVRLHTTSDVRERWAQYDDVNITVPEIKYNQRLPIEENKYITDTVLGKSLTGKQTCIIYGVNRQTGKKEELVHSEISFGK